MVIAEVIAPIVGDSMACAKVSAPIMGNRKPSESLSQSIPIAKKAYFSISGYFSKRSENTA